jgi:pimeloyl-ACP methyl ester carboxylesterase
MARADAETDQIRTLSRLAFDELGGAAEGIGRIERAVADRVYWALGPLGRPVHFVQDAVEDRVLAALRSGARAVGRVADSGLARRPAEFGRSLSSTPPGAAALAAINGLIGDVLEREGSALQEPMAVRVAGHPIDLETAALTDAFPTRTGRLVVFLHGLMETELSWRLGARAGRETYGERLARDLGCTPVYVRYNTGRHISANGRSLSELLADLVEAWPVEVEQIALVGHSMGGLVSRSACYQASESGQDWVQQVRHVVSLGSPHMGAPLEQAVHAASAALYALPETRPFAAFLRRRSAGIRDLRQGSLVDEDWQGHDPDALRAAACAEVPLLEHATHCFVAATVTRSPRHPIARVVGDCLVLQPSASGRSRRRRIPFRAEDGAHLGGTHHLALLNHPAVYEHLRRWLATSPQRIAAHV